MRDEGPRRACREGKQVSGELEGGIRGLEAVIEGLEKKHVAFVEEAKAVEEKEKVKSRASKARSKINEVSEVAQDRIKELRFQIEKLRDDGRT